MMDGMDRAVRPGSSRVALLWFGLVVLAVLCTWILGNLPWVLDGFRLPSDRAVPGSAADGLAEVRLAIPLVTARITALVAFTTLGAVVATLLPLAFTDLPRGLAVVSAGLTVAATGLTVTFASRSGISSHAADAFAGDQRVLDGLVAGVLLVALAAAVLGSLGAAQIGLLPLPVAVVVGQLPVWLGQLLDVRGDGILYQLSALVLLCAAFMISVRRSWGWVVLWPVALALVWTAAPLRITTAYLQDRLRPASGVNERNLDELYADAARLFRATYWHTHQVWWPGVAAAVLALAGVLVQRRRTGRAATSTAVA